MKYVIYLLLAFGIVISSHSLNALDIDDKEVIEQIISQFTEGWNITFTQNTLKPVEN